MMSISPYIQIAREAIQSSFDKHTIDKYLILEQYPQMSMKKASFVTLTLNGHLRGCIGSLIAHRPLIDDLISNAQSAAFHDPRFAPLTPQEFTHTKIEISLLSEPKHIDYIDKADLKSKIHVNEDGVILQLGDNHQATFLPQVWEELKDFESFFSHLGMKAGIGNDPIVYHPNIFIYQVEKIKEQ